LAYPELAKSRDRIEERVCRATDNIAWLEEPHPDWAGLRGIAAITSTRTDKKAGTTTVETRFSIASPRPVAAAILAAARAHWSLANNLRWMPAVITGEDPCQTPKKHPALNLASIRKLALGLLKRHPAKIPMNIAELAPAAVIVVINDCDQCSSLD
jgi:predicted transposase YbfD/YdcC